MCNDPNNNTLHTLYHCPIATYLWQIARDIITIVADINIIIDIRTALINYYACNNKLDKAVKTFINIILIVIRRVIYTIYYREDTMIFNSTIEYKILKNLRLIQRSRKES